MEELCGSDEGWMRVAYLNMSDPSEQCPEGFRLYEENGVRACGRPSTSSGSCVSTTYASKGISYSQVCGKLLAINLVKLMLLRVMISTEFILMVLVSHMVILVVIFGALWVVIKILLFTVIAHVVVSVLELLLHLLVMTISVNLVLLTLPNLNFILMILSGMVKDVVVLRNHVVGFLVFLGFIRLWDTLPLTILR